MENLTLQDLQFINEISIRNYKDNSFLTNATANEKQHLQSIKLKLKDTANFFKNKYDSDYGIFESSIVTGNDIAIGGTRLKRIWSGIFKGNTNKQYSAQISFVLNPHKPCLDVGFFFGRAHGHSVKKEDKVRLEAELNNLTLSISNKINIDALFKEKFYSLCDLGFIAYSNNTRVKFEDWSSLIIKHTNISQILVEVYPNDIGEIEFSQLDFYVSQIVFLLSAISNNGEEQKIKPLSIEQRTKQLQRLSEIGLKGEKYIFELEKARLRKKEKSPIHKSLISDHYGYDIHSFDDQGNDQLIEVKTTCRMKGEYNSQKFFLSTNEYNVFQNNKDKYRLYRVYDIERNPHFEIIDLDSIEICSDGYYCIY